MAQNTLTYTFHYWRIFVRVFFVLFSNILFFMILIESNLNPLNMPVQFAWCKFLGLRLVIVFTSTIVFLRFVHT